MAPVTPKANRGTGPVTPQSAPVSPTTGLLTRSRARIILEKGEDPFASEPVQPRRRVSQRKASGRNDMPVTPPSSPSLTPPHQAAMDCDVAALQPQPFPRQASPTESELYFAPAKYTFPKERTPLIISQEEVDQIARLPRLPTGFGARAASATPSTFSSGGPPEWYYRAPTPGFPVDWSAVNLPVEAQDYNSSQILRDQLKVMTPEERASHHEYKQFVRGLSRGTTPALSTCYAPTPRGAPLPLLPSPIAEAEELTPEPEPVRPRIPKPEPLGPARMPSTLGPVRGDRKASLRSRASNTALSAATRLPPTPPSRPRRTSAKYRRFEEE